MEKLSIDLISVLILIALGHGIFLGLVFFFHKKGNPGANKYFGILILSCSLSIFYGVLNPTGLYKIIPHLNWAGYPLQLLFGPFLYLYMKSITGREIKNKVLHFIPFIAVIICMLPYFSLDGAEKIFYVENRELLNRVFPITWLNGVTQVQMWSYFIWVVLFLRRHTSQVKSEYSYLKGVNLTWIRTTIIHLAIIFLIMLVRIATEQFLDTDFFLFDTRLIPLLASLALFRAGYKAMVQKEILHPEMDVEEHTPKLKRPKPEKPIDPAILEYMESEKPYLNPELNLMDLANELGMTRNDLSREINESSHGNFYDFVNRYRIEEVKKYLLDRSKDDITLLGLAFECGFNSKATFNRIFKKTTGLTPSAFKKSVG